MQSISNFFNSLNSDIHSLCYNINEEPEIQDRRFASVVLRISGIALAAIAASILLTGLIYATSMPLAGTLVTVAGGCAIAILAHDTTMIGNNLSAQNDVSTAHRHIFTHPVKAAGDYFKAGKMVYHEITHETPSAFHGTIIFERIYKIF